MVRTEQLELRTETVEQLVNLLERGFDRPASLIPEDRRHEIADRLEEQISRPSAVAFCGLPGAGKSRTAEVASEVYDAPTVSMGDGIRQAFVEEYHSDPSSEELGDYAAAMRDGDPESIPRMVTEFIEDAYPAEDLFVIDGVRSVMDYEVLEDYFDEFYLIEVTANFYTRLSRLRDRGREGEDAFDAVDLAERDENERQNLGFGELQDTVYIDLSMENKRGPDELAINLSSVVENNLPFEIANGMPLGLDADLEKHRKELAGDSRFGG